MSLKTNLIKTLNKLPYVRGLYRENLQFKKNSCFPAGHFYSPIVDVEDMKKRQDIIWENENTDGIIGIDLNLENQINLIENFHKYYDEIPFSDEKAENTRYFFKNDWYSYTDAIFLYSIIRHYKPKQIIEVGSGFSSAVMLDTNETFFDNQINLTFIDPNTERLNSLLKESDKTSTRIIQKEVQSVPLDVFEKLNTGDILFIDSSHVAKTGSDVNYILFEILPRLKKGVLIHFHDIPYPFEYPKKWVFGGMNWNETYFLKSFLMYNSAFDIKLFSHYLHQHHEPLFEKMPLCYKDVGCNIWLEKK